MKASFVLVEVHNDACVQIVQAPFLSRRAPREDISHECVRPVVRTVADIGDEIGFHHIHEANSVVAVVVECHGRLDRV